jgi:uroporphyrinogen-III synthase
MKTALVTRPREDAEDLTRTLKTLGFAVQLEPLLTIALYQNVDLPLDGVQGCLATSANGVRALAANSARRDLPIWAVGAATADCATALGFHPVESADGDVSGLADLVARRVDPNGGALLHAAGSVLAGDLQAMLAKRGFTVRRVPLYEAHTADTLSPQLIRALDGRQLDLALFFSPRTAATFVTLVTAAGRSDACRAIDAYALSEAVAKRLSALPWRRVRVACQPTQAALLAAIDSDTGP